MKILILLLGRIGDMVLATPAFRIIKENFPDSTIHVIASCHNLNIVQQNIYVDEVILWNNAPKKFFKAFWQIKKESYDFYIDPKDHYSWTSKFIALNAKAKKRIWFNGKESADSKININVKLLNQEGYKHFTQHVLLALAPLGIHYEGQMIRPELFEIQDSKLFVENFLEENQIDEFVLLNISAGKKGMVTGRTWQKEKWKQFLKKITADGIIVLINAINEERIIAEELAANSDNTFIIQSRTIDDVISVVKKARFVITPDTSIVHISAAFNKPLIALYSNCEENTLKFYPSNSVKEVLIAAGANRPVEDIKTSEMLNAYEKIISRISRKV